ncbi:MAG: chromosome segregation protein SMC [Clostridia bacterium]|nr:chromosome segregation protein SMC [Clostridia bacterium]
MRLKKLELAGFKSFPTKTEIVFGDGITGIVGPNGSGKSNIGDAVRWVLGEQSAKTLRGASMSDVIFNGTQKRKPMSYCEVSLIFDNEDRALASDYAETVVTRRVWRSGESNYFLNGASCRLKDVIDLFRDTGIGKEGYSIIGQGRIDEILSRKSEDRRQVFEEAAGIVKYRARKDEADRKLQRTLDNAARVDDILEELSRQLGPLEEQSRAARRWIELSGELKGLDLTLFLIRSDRMNARLEELRQELDGLKEILECHEAVLAQKGLERDACQERIAALDREIREARDSLLAQSGRVHEKQNERAALAARREARAGQMRQLLAEQENAAARLRVLEEASAAGGDAEKDRRAEADQAEAALAGAQQREAAAAEARRKAEDELEAYKEEVIRAMNRSSTLLNDQTRLTTVRGQMTLRLGELEKELAEADAERERLETALHSREAALRAEEERQETLSADHRACVRRFDEADADLIRLRNEAEKLTAAQQSDQTRWRLLDEMTREMEGYSQSVRRAVQYARERGQQGVKGVLAQLISVPGEIETAIDMALGAAQQNIVTDTQETAKELIDYLRAGRLGRATFLPIEAVKSKVLSDRERRVLSMPGCVGVASELVQCAPEYRGIVENLLGRTVIADSLDHGIPIMNAGGHAFRLVTLAGDVMHTGGSMTGGSAQSKMVNLLGRQRELKELTARLRQNRLRLDEMKALVEETQTEKNKRREEVNAALEAVHQQEIAVARETEHTASARRALEAGEARLDAFRQAEEQLREQLAEIDRQLEELSADGAERFDEEAASRETERLQTIAVRARAAHEQASEDVVSLTIMRSDLLHALDVARRDLERSRRDREQLQGEQEARTQRIAALRAEEDADIAADADLVVAEAHEKALQAQMEKDIAAKEDTRTGEQTALADLLRGIEGIHADRERDSDRQHRAEIALSRVQNDLRSLQDRIWDTWELTYAGAEPFRITEGFQEKVAEKRAKELSAEMKSLGSVNLAAVEQYAETKARFDDLSAQQNDLRKAEKDLRELIDSLLREMRTTFTSNFSLLQGYFSETFTRLFGGGKAEIVLTDPDDPLNCGIEVNAQPPGKKLQLLSLLSGGERALTAIAILFAMLKLKPTPFCILDEIEAALDDANIGYYADYLREYSADTQFIVITHRKGTMERCNSLYGVSMEEQGVSKMVSVSLKDYAE